jgi:hypothetical protein
MTPILFYLKEERLYATAHAYRDLCELDVYQ